MSLSVCQKCGGHIPLGPDATNRCEKCGGSVWLEMHGDPTMRQAQKMADRLARAMALLREARESIPGHEWDNYAEGLDGRIDALLKEDA